MNIAGQLAGEFINEVKESVIGRRKRAVIYCRVSTDKQEEDGESLDYQAGKCQKFAEIHDIDVIMTLKEAKSGYIHYTLREKLMLARQMIRDGIANMIIVWDLRRFSRNFVHSAMIFEEIEEYEGEIVSVSENIDNSLTGKLIRSILAWSAESERHKIVEYASRRYKSRLELGLPVGTGRAPYGWRWKDKEKTCYEIDKEQTMIRLAILHMFVELDMSLRQIMHKLTEDRIPTPRWEEEQRRKAEKKQREQEEKGEKQEEVGEEERPIWKYTTIREILNDPANIGILVICKARQTTGPDGKRHTTSHPDRKEIPGGIPAILTDVTLYERALEKLATNKVEKSKQPLNLESYLLRGHIYCNCCGHRMKPRTQKKGRMTKGGNSKDYPFYLCTNMQNKYGDCTAKTVIPTSPLDDIVWEECCAIFQHLEVLQGRIEKKMQEEIAKLLENTTGKEQLQRMEGEITYARQERDKQARGSYLYNIISQDIQIKEEQIARYKEEMGSTGNLAKAPASYRQRITGFLDFLNVMRGHYHEADFQQKRSALEVLGVKVVVSDPPEVHGLSVQANGPTDQEWYTAREAAAALGVNRKTIYFYIRKGQLTANQQGLKLHVHKDELLRLQEAGFRQRNTPEIVRQRIEITYSPLLGDMPRVLNPTGVSVSFCTRK